MASSSDVQEHDGTKNWPLFDVVQDYSDHHYAKSNKEISDKDLIYKKISKEWRILGESLPDSIYVRVYEQRIDLMRAAIVGPPGTPYQDDLFVFDIRFPSDYPNMPPLVHYRSHGFEVNPNLHINGYVCLSLLNTWFGHNHRERWLPAESTILQVLVSIQALVLNEKPYYNSPFVGKNNEKSCYKYSEKAFQISCYSMACLLHNPPKNFKGLVVGHFRKRARAILTACNVYMNGFERVGCYSYQENKPFQFHKEEIKVDKMFRHQMDILYKNLVAAFSRIDPTVRIFVVQMENMVKEEIAKNQKIVKEKLEKKENGARTMLRKLKKLIWPSSSKKKEKVASEK